MSWYVFRDGQAVSEPLEDENACHTWLQKHQGMSNDWAIQHEGYSISEGRVVPVKSTAVPPAEMRA